MELHQLEQFVAVAEEQHFTRAAQRLAMAQSALSASVRSLEKELGAVLFRRSTRHVELTEAGRVLLVEARRILAAVQGARDSVAAVQGVKLGTLRVGHSSLIESLAPQLDLPLLLGRFHRQYPRVELQLHQAPTGELLDRLRGGTLDVAFVVLLSQATLDLSATVLAQDSLAMVCSSAHPLANRTSVSFAELAHEPFIDLFPPGAVRHHMNRAFAAVRHERHTVLEVDTVAAALRFVAQGIGITVMSSFAATVDRRICTVPLLPAVPMQILAVTAEDPPENAAARTLLAIVLASDHGALPETGAAPLDQHAGMLG